MYVFIYLFLGGKGGEHSVKNRSLFLLEFESSGIDVLF